MLETRDLPRMSDVQRVMISVEVESILDLAYSDPEHRWDAAKRGRDDYMHRIMEAVPKEDHDHFDLPDEPEESGYESEWQVFTGKVSIDLSVEEWRKVAKGFCLDLAEHDGHELALPDADQLVETMGMMTMEGLLPAVAIQGTDEGWGIGGHQPQLIASFYVSVLVNETGALRNTLLAIRWALEDEQATDTEKLAHITEYVGMAP